MPAPAAHEEAKRRAHLLRDRAEVERLAAQHDPIAAALVDRVLGSARPPGARRTSHSRPKSPPPPRLQPRRRSGRRSAWNPLRASDAMATALAATWSFMSSAPRPQTWSSRSSPDHGSADHSAGSASTVSVWDRSVSRGPPPRPGIRATRLARSGTRRVQLALDTVRLEIGPQELGGARLVPGRVDRVEPDQLPEQTDHLIPQGRGAGRDQSDSFARDVSWFRASQSSG